MNIAQIVIDPEKVQAYNSDCIMNSFDVVQETFCKVSPVIDLCLPHASG